MTKQTRAEEIKEMRKILQGIPTSVRAASALGWFYAFVFAGWILLNMYAQGSLAEKNILPVAGVFVMIGSGAMLLFYRRSKYSFTVLAAFALWGIYISRGWVILLMSGDAIAGMTMVRTLWAVGQSIIAMVLLGALFYSGTLKFIWRRGTHV